MFATSSVNPPAFWYTSASLSSFESPSKVATRWRTATSKNWSPEPTSRCTLLP